MIRHIEYLMLRHECVAIPGFGAIIAHYRPAYIDRELGCMFPPSRTLGFNPDITHNDGLLASSIARGTETTFDNAMAMLSKEVAALKLQLENSGEFALGRLGIFSRSDNGAITFEPFSKTAITPRLAGLRAIAVTPISETVRNEAEATASEQANSSSVRRRVLNIAASVALLLCLGVTMTTPIIENKAAFAGIASGITSTSHVEEPVFEPVSQPDLDLRIALPAKEESSIIKSVAVAEITQNTVPAATLHLDPSDRYYLIVASLPTLEKAKEYIASQNHGDRMEITEADGRFRVYIATGSTIDMARQPVTIDKYAIRYPNAWVCRR